MASVELAQSHVVAPSGRALQSKNDIARNVTRRLTLLSGRAALLMVEPASPVAAVQVRVRLADGKLLGPLALNKPAALPATDGGRAAYSTTKHSILLPKEWIQTGAMLELGQTDFSQPHPVALTVTPGATLRLSTMPVYLFGARAANSVVSDFAMSARTTGTYGIDKEYLQKLPIASFQQTATGAITIDRLVLRARNDANLCHPAMPVSSWNELKSMNGDLNGIMLPFLNNIHSATANRDGDMASSYYGFMQTMDGGVQVAANSGGGLGYVGGGTSVSGSDYRPQNVYSAIFNHEVGHGHNLPHADSAASSGDFPYPQGTKSGSSWGYDANRNQLLSTLQFNGGDCNGRMVDNQCFQRTPMSGGDFDRDAANYRWTMFADYEAALMQEWVTGKVFRDNSVDGGYKQWNKTSRAFENVSDQVKARIGSGALNIDQPVQTVWGTVSHFNASPTANTLVVTPAYTGNLPRQFDPTVQADLDLINTYQPGGYGGWYCLNNGCDYTLVASYGDGSVQRVLLAMGYHRWGSPAYTDSGINAATRNILDGANLGSFAVNLPTGRGGLAKLQLFHTPFGSKQQAKLVAIKAGDLGNGDFALMSQWTPADGASGGSGGAGTTQFDASACQAGAVVRRPAR